jgi:hypothetical protein
VPDNRPAEHTSKLLALILKLDPGIEPAIVVERILRISERQQNFAMFDFLIAVV